ncbi:maleylpyruvate isomerase family mycothiol-dependent enzyme [Corynebacterium sp.]|uniref:maleylpyruvate isomerase family mycothiol-dependent enzyme n=1 Tax=Corynebacterium sp. TaxID=1720 RepID=UPI0028A632C0|nr:maleylpyruvate isomerase family mycothiol-dependent enzyme [Corynebacterium sp.]
MDTKDAWTQIHAERRRLADVLHEVSAEKWSTRTLCSRWSVSELVAHLTAGASTTPGAWMWSRVWAGFNADRHNQRQLEKHLGRTPAETLANFRAVTGNTVAPSKDHAAWLGEVIVHGQDIARPLGIDLVPDPAAVLEVARFFAARNFTVNSLRRRRRSR